MTTRTLALLLTAAFVALTLAPAEAKTRPACEHARGTTITADTTARVFSTTTRSRANRDRSTVRVYACKPGSRKLRRLETFKNNLDFTDRVVASARGGDRWLVLQINNESGVALHKTHALYDLRNGKRVAQFYEDADSSGEAEPIVATAGGAFARLRFDAVVTYDATGEHVLDPGPATDLAAAGNTIYWTSGGAPRSASLRGPAAS